MPTAIIGARWYKYTAPIKLAANAVKGTNYVTLESNPGFWVSDMPCSYLYDGRISPAYVVLFFCQAGQ